MNKLQPVPLGLAIGILWAAYVFIIALTAMAGWGEAVIPVLASLYIGYSASFLGAIIGAIWAFVDGLIGGVVVAWLYNMFAK